MNDSPLREHSVSANGITHHVIEHPGDASRTVLLLHGYSDLARTFTRVIVGLGERGWRVVAPDFRGHGDTDRAPPGSYYHVPDYVADVVAVCNALAIERSHVVAHSMGGSVATYLAGAFPSRVRSLALLEGVGPPAMPAEVVPDRMAGWIEGVQRVRSRGARRMASLDDVIARMKLANPSVEAETLREVAAMSVRATEDGAWVFRFDPLHQTISPGRFDAEAFEAFIARIVCPVLLIDGGEVAGFEELMQRAERYPNARKVTLTGAGHMMHWTRPAELVDAVDAFLRETTEG
jgi:pimeloyl-ACP methyl ester carboxylesterase